MQILFNHLSKHPAGFCGRVLRSLLFGFAVACCSTPAIGQPTSGGNYPDDETAEKGLTLIEEGTRPLATVTFASADRFVEEARYLFDVAGSPEAFKVVEDWLSGTLNDLEGFNRDKPFGIMVYLPVAFPPLPEFIGFVPVDSVEAATKVVEKAPVVISRTSEEGRYEVIAPNRTYPVLLRDGYAFLPLGNDPPEGALDRKLPNPAQLLASQAQQFDVSVSLDVESLPIATRTLLMNVITAGLSTQLQQRDGEPEGAYRIRKTEGTRVLDALNQFILDCQRITLGLDVVRDEHAINIDVVVDALEGTKMLKEILQSTERQSYFIPLLDDDAAVSLSMSSMMADRDRNAFIEMMEGIRMEVARLIAENKLGAAPDEYSPIGQGLSAIQKSLEVGHVDVFAQFYRDSSGKLAIVGATRVEEGDAMGAGLLDGLTRMKDVEEIKRAGILQIGSGEHQGITFHRLTFAQQAPEAVEVFGQNVGLTLGVGARSMWAVLGGEDSYSTLKAVMDQLEEANQAPQGFRTPPNFRIIVNVNQLVEMATIANTAGRKTREAKEQAAGAEARAALAPPQTPAEVASDAGGESVNGGSNPRESRRAAFARRRARGREIFRETLAEGDDRIEIDSRLTESGARVRIRLEEGFVKTFGRLLASRLVPDAEIEAKGD